MKRLLRLLLVMGMVGCEGRLQRPPQGYVCRPCGSMRAKGSDGVRSVSPGP